MGKIFSLLAIVISFFCLTAFAQEAPPVELGSVFQQVADLIAQWGGFSWYLKIAGVITVILSAVKTSFLKPYWDKLGDFKAYAGPILGLAAGILSLGISDEPISWAGIAAYIGAGAGAVFLHEILDTLKAIPGIGSMWVSIIDLIKVLLKAPVSNG